MIHLLAAAVVVLTGLYLVALGVLSLAAPARARRFLSGFASSARIHYLELLLRVAAGGALVAYAPRMLFSAAHSLVGWILIITTVALLVVPWRWHRRFAQWGVPQALAHLGLLGIASLLLGALVVASVILGPGH
jgi:hypothetical protein